MSIELVLEALLLISVTRTSFESLLIIVLLTIATCTFLHERFPPLLDRSKGALSGIFWKFARIGERVSPLVSICTVIMAGYILINPNYV